MIELANNIILQPLGFDVVVDIFNTIDRERNYLRKWLPFVDLTESMNDSYLFVKNVVDSEQTVFSIHENGIFIGVVGFNNMDISNQKAEIGYWLSEKNRVGVL